MAAVVAAVTATAAISSPMILATHFSGRPGDLLLGLAARAAVGRHSLHQAARPGERQHHGDIGPHRPLAPRRRPDLIQDHLAGSGVQDRMPGRPQDRWPVPAERAAGRSDRFATALDCADTGFLPDGYRPAVMTRRTSDPRRCARGVAHRARRRRWLALAHRRRSCIQARQRPAAKDARRRQLRSLASQQDLRPGGRDVRPFTGPRARAEGWGATVVWQ